MIVYKVTNRINGKVYIGISRDTAERRWAVHCYEAGRDTYGQVLHKAIRKYGVDSFDIETIASAKTWEDLCWLECHLIAEHRTYGKGYNMTHGGEGKYGYVTSDETKRKIGAKSKGRVPNAAARAKMSAAQKRRIAEGRGQKGAGKEGRKAIAESNKRRCKPVTINGVTYESTKAAKAAIGSYQVYKALNGGAYYGTDSDKRCKGNS